MSYEEFKATKFYKWTKKVLKFLLDQWFFVLLGVFVLLAYFFPEFAKQGGTIKAQYSIGYGAVAVIFLVSGLSMTTKDLFSNILHWRAHFTVLSSSFLITSAIIYGIASGIKASGDNAIDDWLLVGMIVTHACPTTVSSNVVMTKAADGNHVLTTCEVFIGNVLGAFITPALVQMYLTGTWDFGNPTHQEERQTVSDLYGSVMKQIGLSVFVPLFVGQVLQNIWPKQVKWTLTTFYLNKVGSFMLLLIMFQSFSTAFAQNAFESVSHASIIFLVFFNIGIYLFFTVLVFFYSRPYFLVRIYDHEPTEQDTRTYTWGYKLFRPFYYNRRDTVSVMLCGPAKTAALGVSLVSSQYGAHNPKLGVLLVPLVLYQAEQVLTAQVLVNFMKKWVHAEDKPAEDEEAVGAPSDETQQDAVKTSDSETHYGSISEQNDNENSDEAVVSTAREAR
ncbi:hypothetical protein FT663_03753 [Candidozyma haemuli var. vulneris]|uniref:Uncharacterized protein n=1 Tax=Candidozyma haemuli TaxID=45357 RepID=A0A2V1ARA1_9ASCO|nr:hypothetical protein CXQ85_002197 [[Candida] haemuloni]KAF3989082.1 hypothetical protein FT663_03753 [[Candida] haemuloni var. vulneris]KAF3991205.1 hypothetical protein FT662_01880 [[Candida] haemuloni var. vulneris]PVH20409.1 hypothetical protein CXQ85_002197 [[Candida] haemuloni]